MYKDQLFLCPECRIELKDLEGSLFCKECRFKYKIYCGVPNLKKEKLFKGEDNLLNNLSMMFDKLSFVQFIEYCDSQQAKNALPWEFRRTSRLSLLDLAEKKAYYAQYEKNVLARIGARQFCITKSVCKKIGKELHFNRVLDVGTGRGPWSISVANTFNQIVGIDMDMVSLLIAKKYCEEKGINNVWFVSALAEKMPFRDSTFDLINCQSNLEHFSAQLESLLEINRVLASDGYCIIDSPNRFNIFSRESHTSIWFLGFLPRRIAHFLSTRLKGVPFDDIRLLSYFRLKRLSANVFRDNYKILSPLDALETPKLKMARRIPLMKFAFKLGGPSHYLVVKKARST